MIPERRRGDDLARGQNRFTHRARTGDVSRLVRYTAYGVAGLVAVVAVLAVVSALVGLVVSAVTIVASVVAVALAAAVLAAVVAGGAAALGGTAAVPGGGSDAEPTDEEDPVETLRRRYVEGEISEAEFERRLDRTISRGERGSGQESGSERERERI